MVGGSVCSMERITLPCMIGPGSIGFAQVTRNRFCAKGKNCFNDKKQVD